MLVAPIVRAAVLEPEYRRHCLGWLMPAHLDNLYPLRIAHLTAILAILHGFDLNSLLFREVKAGSLLVEAALNALVCNSLAAFYGVAKGRLL